MGLGRQFRFHGFFGFIGLGFMFFFGFIGLGGQGFFGFIGLAFREVLLPCYKGRYQKGYKKGILLELL